MVNYSNISGATGGFPLFFITDADGDMDENNYDLKLNHDSYEVYVDDKLIGKHKFVVQQEDANAISDFLHEQGFRHSPIEINGDHIIVHAQSEEEKDRMERAVKVFLNNR